MRLDSLRTRTLRTVFSIITAKSNPDEILRHVIYSLKDLFIPYFCTSNSPIHDDYYFAYHAGDLIKIHKDGRRELAIGDLPEFVPVHITSCRIICANHNFINSPTYEKVVKLYGLERVEWRFELKDSGKGAIFSNILNGIGLVDGHIAISWQKADEFSGILNVEKFVAAYQISHQLGTKGPATCGLIDDNQIVRERAAAVSMATFDASRHLSGGSPAVCDTTDNVVGHFFGVTEEKQDTEAPTLLINEMEYPLHSNRFVVMPWPSGSMDHQERKVAADPLTHRSR